ncbi:MAG TPA: hypothetical protein DCP03_19860 [Polaromonas sp.]|uniref:hypothetical protein n=1 Tax=Polaromonas sp. UBA4122 TaxID=1947074 RepID=UPI000EE7E03A|nr:hypothetical protein [Polaromonas sp. UBA4122]HAL40231.1 hypothetical protein [Polaromonas sp.]
MKKLQKYLIPVIARPQAVAIHDWEPTGHGLPRFARNDKTATFVFSRFLSAMPAREVSDAELELHIQSLDRLMVQAMAEENRQEALHWLQAKTLAISQRSPAQRARQPKTVRHK